MIFIFNKNNLYAQLLEIKYLNAKENCHQLLSVCIPSNLKFIAWIVNEISNIIYHIFN
jgi:hypothetical protein